MRMMKKKKKNDRISVFSQHVKGNAKFALKYVRALNGKRKSNKLWEYFEDFSN